MVDTKLMVLSYSQFKGTGKCWIAEVDPETRKIIEFLTPESHEKEGYKGVKRFKVPLIEGKAYRVVEEGSKSYDSNKTYIVENSELKLIK